MDFGGARNEGLEFYSIYSVRAFEGFLKKCSISGRFAVVRVHRHGRLWFLFSISAEIPKLDVAGSSPVSRSIKSITYKLRSKSSTSINLVCVAPR